MRKVVVNCNKPPQCGGVTKLGSKYYLNKHYAVATKKGATVWMKGGAKIAQTIVYISYNG